jgi:uncharacterized protein YbaP (TraB family)
VRLPLLRRLGLLLCGLALCAAVRADGALHSLWELHGRHNTVYLLGSIHVLRPSDYPLPQAVLQAYADAKSVFMEVNLGEIDMAQLQSEMLASAMLPEGKTLPDEEESVDHGGRRIIKKIFSISITTRVGISRSFAAEAI